MKTLGNFKRKLIVAGLFLSVCAKAQQSAVIAPQNKTNYNTAIGLRAGGTSGLTIKHFFGSANAIEGIVGIWPNTISLTGLYEKNVGAGVAGLNFYYGGGAHISAGTNSYYDYRRDGYYYYRYPNGSPGLGIDGIVGLEYKIPPIPIAISLDLKPFVEVNSIGRIYTAIDPGLGIKVAF